jgi:hypothetical protein
MTDLDTTNVTELRPSPHKGEGPAGLRPRTPKDPTAASRSRRYRRKAKGAPTVTAAASPPANQVLEKPNDFNTSVTVEGHADGQLLRDGEKASRPSAVTPFVQPRWQVADDSVTVPERRLGAVDVAAYAAAIGLATVAAWFSIKGMVVLFPGAPLAVVAMAIAMETAKLVTAGWLASRWRATARVWRLVLVTLVAGLAVINATGVYAQLVAAHVGERGAAVARLETQDAALASRIEVARHAVADLDARVSQIDAAIAEATRRGRTTGAMAIMEAQRRARSGLVDERNREAGTLAALKAERASLAAKGRQAEVEAAPIRYVAAVFGVTDQEMAIRWLIALMVLCCDPLAITLTAAASARRA